MKVRVIRAFCVRGERQEPDTEIEVSELLARELLQMGRVERADGGAKPVPPSGPMTTETAAAVVSGKAPKEKANVSQ